MDSRGFTLLELLLGLAVAIVVMAGIGSLFVYSQRVAYQSQSQAFLQRQGALVMDEMSQRVRLASTLTRGTCKTGNAHSIGATWRDQNDVVQASYCFYQSGSQLKMDATIGPNSGTWDLLSGAAAQLSVTEFKTCGDPSGSPVCTCTVPACAKVTITFQLSDNRANAMTFTTDLTRRNG